MEGVTERRREPPSRSQRTRARIVGPVADVRVSVVQVLEISMIGRLMSTA